MASPFFVRWPQRGPVWGDDRKFHPQKAARKNRNLTAKRQSCGRRALGKGPWVAPFATAPKPDTVPVVRENNG
jgi:hypothetical protein